MQSQSIPELEYTSLVRIPN